MDVGNTTRWQHKNYRNRTPNRSNHQTVGMRTPEQTNPGLAPHINVQLSTHAHKQSSISMLGLSSSSNAHNLNYMNANNTRQAKLNQWPTHKRYWQQNNAAWQTDANVCSNALNENWAEHKAEHASAHAKHKHCQKQTSTCHCTHSSIAQEQQKHVCACAYWSSSLWISSCSQ